MIGCDFVRLDSEMNLFGRQTKFEEEYLIRTYRKLTSRPDIALTELIANAWDAGASRVEIVISPIKKVEDLYIRVEDDGSGMTKEEFEARWMTLAYNRLRHQGEHVEMPPERKAVKRRAYGRNGIGRHSMLCFSNRYEVETWKNGTAHRFELEASAGETALRINSQKQFRKLGHGTIVSARIDKIQNYPEMSEIKRILSARFIYDPEFQLLINGEQILLNEHTGIIAEEEIDVTDGIRIKVTALSSDKTARRSQQHGIAFWVNKRLVGEPSWYMNKKNIADGRTTIARQFTIIVQTDDMLEDIKEDWTGFKDNPRVRTLYKKVEYFANKLFREVNKEKNEELKHNIVRMYAKDIQLSDLSVRREILDLVDQVVDEAPDLSKSYLELMVGKLLEINKSRSKKILVEKIFSLTEKDADTLNSILDDWDISDMECVLDEIDRRLATIQAIERFSKTNRTDELHVLHPLVLEAKWIFGPEYDSNFYGSNSRLSTILRKHLKRPEAVTNLSQPRKRPDIILFNNGSMIGYATEDFNSETSLMEFQKLLIIELKCGGSDIGVEEVGQAEKYVNELYFSNAFNSKVQIDSFVVGHSVSDRMGRTKELRDSQGFIIGKIVSASYSQLIGTAQRRLLGLKTRLTERYEQIESNDLLKRALSPASAQIAIDYSSKNNIDDSRD